MDYTVKQKIKGKSNTDIFDQMDKLPDMSLRELYYILKASRRKIKEKIINGADTGFKMV